MPPKPVRCTPEPAGPGLVFEQALWLRGSLMVAGVDEAGRGAWAGPVFAGAVILAANEGISRQLDGVNDSKLLTPAQRDKFADVIRMYASSWGVGLASVEEINTLGILPATRLAMMRALQAMTLHPTHALVDYIHLPNLDIPQTAIIHGDGVSLSIAAASILAKTARDACMQALDVSIPGYEFSRHKGYGTALHQCCLAEKGPSSAHRIHYRPIADLLPGDPADPPDPPVPII